MPFPVEISYVRQAEKKLGVMFPTAYVVRICRQNGGSLVTEHDCWNLFPIYDDSDKKRLRRTCNDVVRENLPANQWPGFPKNAVAIGSNGTGDRLVLLKDPSISTQLEHAVYWWDHETDEINFIADDLSELPDE